MRSNWTLIGCYIILKLMWKIISAPFRLLFRYIRQLYSTHAGLIEYEVENSEVIESEYKPQGGEVLGGEVCPEFQEIINITNEVVLGIEKIIRTPDETALIRILTDDAFTKQYKRKVYSKRGKKFIKVDGEKYFLEKEEVHLD